MADAETHDSAERDFYDRQLRVLGKEAMERMQSSKVLIVGLGGLGVEIAKNVILTGVHSVYLLDNGSVSWSDLSTNFYVTEHDIGANRVDSVLGQLKELNSFVRVERVSSVSEDLLRNVCVAVWTDTPIHSLISENALCRSTDTRFIACETHGVFGGLFCDMGDNFTVFDENGEPMVENMIVNITNENPALVTVLDDKINHGLGIGDRVIFMNVEGMNTLNDLSQEGEGIEIELGEGTDAHSFFLKNFDTTSLPQYIAGSGYCKQRRPPKNLSFVSLGESLNKDNKKGPQVLDFDFGKFGWGKEYIHHLFAAMKKWLDLYREDEDKARGPRSYHEEDALEFLQMAREELKSAMPEKESEGEGDGEGGEAGAQASVEVELPSFPHENLYAKLFAYGYRGSINPMTALFGGFAGQEVQKACSGKFSPLHQWFYLDAIEVLDFKALPLSSQAQPRECRDDGQIMVLGDVFQERIAKQRVFIVGSGALGCEYMKNLAMMGVGTDDAEEGRILVTDMDCIEVSNLNRQFLFRGHHVGKMKSTCAAETVRTMNRKIHVDAMTDKVAPDTEEVFNDPFWDSLDCVVNALDNIKARLYVDEKCVYYNKPLIEAGTLGPKANTQAVIPHVTQSYGVERDPPEKGFPQCTLKNFPHKIEHTIAWARDLFEGYFIKGPKNANLYLNSESFLDDIRASETVPAVRKIVETVYRDLVVDRPKSYEDCIAWARTLFQEHYYNVISQLLYNFPSDHVTESGVPFWSGDKRCPAPLVFNPTDPVHLSYVVSAANIRAAVYGVALPGEDYDYVTAVGAVDVPEFTPKDGVEIEVEAEDKDDGVDDDGFPFARGPPPATPSFDDDSVRIQELMQLIPPPAELAGLKLNVNPFEKDDDSNSHVDFMTAASNARALNYRIPVVDRHTTKGIAGRIIPAMVTSTALITGFGCLELYKVIQRKKDIESYRNAYLNLALPLCSQSEPVPPTKLKYLDVEYTQWDMFRINLGRDVTLSEFLEEFKNSYKLEVVSLSYGPALVYANFMPKPDRMCQKLAELCFSVTKTEPLKSQIFCVFVILCEDENEEDVDVPDVRYQFRGF